MSRIGRFVRYLPYIVLPATWPFINFLNVNRGELFSLPRFGLYYVVTILALSLLYLIGRALLGRWFGDRRVAVIAAVAIYCLFGYAVIAVVAENLWGRSFLTTWIVATTGLLLLAFFVSRSLLFQRVVLLFSAIVVGIPAIQYVAYLAQTTGRTELASGPSFVGSGVGQGPSRDPSAGEGGVYHIVLDTYPRADVLEAQFDYDNGDFLDGLRGRGFFVADQAHSNYDTTQRSLPSTLAMEYLFVGDASTDEIRAASARYADLGKNQAIRSFHDAGYHVSVLRYDAPFCDSGFIDDCFSRRSFQLGELELNMLRQTPVVRIIQIAFNNLLNDVAGLGIDEVIRYLSELDTDKPVFAHIHVLLPHPPARFLPDCTPRSDVVPEIDDAGTVISDEGFLGNLQCANSQTNELLDVILARDPDAAIVIQGDHGVKWKPKLDATPGVLPGAPDDGGAGDLVLKARYGVLNAWRLPQTPDCVGSVYPAISTINTYPLLLKCAGFQDVELLPDRLYWASGKSGSVRYDEIPVARVVQ